MENTEKEKSTVENLGEAISVFVQVAHLAQSKGILSLEDAVKVKSAIDFVNAASQPQQPPVEINGKGDDIKKEKEKE